MSSFLVVLYLRISSLHQLRNIAISIWLLQFSFSCILNILVNEIISINVLECAVGYSDKIDPSKWVAAAIRVSNLQISVEHYPAPVIGMDYDG